MFMSVCDIRWSSRPVKLSAHGLLYTPSPGHGKTALCAFDANTPLGAAKAAVNWVLAVVGSTLTN